MKGNRERITLLIQVVKHIIWILRPIKYKSNSFMP